MSDYVITKAENQVRYVVRTSDWTVVATCDSDSTANLVLAALNASV